MKNPSVWLLFAIIGLMTTTLLQQSKLEEVRAGASMRLEALERQIGMLSQQGNKVYFPLGESPVSAGSGLDKRDTLIVQLEGEVRSLRAKILELEREASLPKSGEVKRGEQISELETQVLDLKAKLLEHEKRPAPGWDLPLECREALYWKGYRFRTVAEAKAAIDKEAKAAFGSGSR